MDVFIMRAIPGMGKSTFVKVVIPEIMRAKGSLPEYLPIFSADKYFIGDDGVYRFDRNKIGSAHGSCKKGFDGIFKLPTDFSPHGVVVDNTNTTAREIRFYYERAEKSSKVINTTIFEIHPADGDWEAAAERCAKRNVHGVPRDAIIKMKERLLKSQLPAEWNVVKVLRGDGYFEVEGKRYDVSA